MVITNGTGSGNYIVGSEVDVNANPADANKLFDRWEVVTGKATIVNPNDANTKVLTGSEATEIKAFYKDKLFALSVAGGTGSGNYPGGTSVNLLADDPAIHKEFSTWEVLSGGLEFGDILDENTSVTTGFSEATVKAVYTDVLYNLTVTNGEGSGDYIVNADLTIVANTPAENMIFSGWELVQGDADINNLNSTETTVILNGGAAEVKANYKAKEVALEYVLSVTNGTGSGTYNQSEGIVIKSNAPEASEEFKGWELVSGTAVFENAGAIETTISLGSVNVAVKATYGVKVVEAELFELTVAQGTGSGNYELMESIDIMAGDAAEGQKFKAWELLSGAVDFGNINASTTTVKLTEGAATIKATYEDVIVVVDKFDLTVNNGTGSGTYSVDTEITIVAEEPGINMVFKQWELTSGNSIINNVESNITTLTTGDEPSVITALYENEKFELTVTNGAGDGMYELGSEVDIVADVKAGFKFLNWEIISGGGVFADLNASSTKITVEAKKSEITAVYGALI